MAPDWQAGRLGDLVVKLGSGATPRGGADVYVDEGVALIRSQNIYDDRFAAMGLAFITDEAAAQLAGVSVAAGDVLVNITGDSVARVNRAPESVLPARVNQHVAIVRPRHDILDARFLHAVLVAPAMKRRLLALASAGATRKALTKAMLMELVVPLPALSEQREIAQVLGALDEKIRCNRRLADLADATWTAFASEAPRGSAAEPVEVAMLIGSGVLAVSDGYRAKNSELAGIGMRFLRAGNLTIHGLDLEGADLASPQVTNRAGNKISAPWDTAFTSKGTVGRITLVDPNVDSFLYSPQICFWRSLDHERLSPFVLHAWMRSARFTAQVEAVKGQTDMADYVSLRDQRAMMFDLPGPVQQAVVHSFAEPLARLAAAARHEARTLTVIRDGLLPKLVSGQIRVPLSDDVDEPLGVALTAVT